MTYGASFYHVDYQGDAAYASLLRTQCDQYTPDREMKNMWTGPNPTDYATSGADAWYAIALADKKPVRGHVLGPYATIDSAPAWYRTGVTSSNCRPAIEGYMSYVLPRYPAVTSWDVLNELLAGSGGDTHGYKPCHDGVPNPWITAFGGSGDAFVQFSFQTAERIAPYMSLSYCDDNTEQGSGSTVEAKRGYVVGLIARAQNAGCRIDAYSMQGHLDSFYQDYRTDAPALRAFLRQLAPMVKLQITELDVGYPAIGWSGTATEWDRRVAETVDGFLDTVLSSGIKCDLLHTWGISDRYTGLAPIGGVAQRPLPFDASFTPKPMSAVLENSFAGRS